MTSHTDEEQKTNIVSPEFSEAANPDQPIEERDMTEEYDRYEVDQPFRNHRIHTEHNVSSADIDRILRPILEAYGIASDDYNPENLSYKIGDKTVHLSISDYDGDPEFNSRMKFMEEAINVIRTIHISNRCSISKRTS